MYKVFNPDTERIYRERVMLNNRGFSLIEALVAVAITFFIATSIAGMLTMFGFHSKRGIDMTCLVNAAASGIEACRGGQTISAYSCGGLNISISINGSCTPAVNQCNQVTATASYGGRQFSLTDFVCNFR